MYQRDQVRQARSQGVALKTDKGGGAVRPNANRDQLVMQ
jgi:hypothetical protein